MNILFIALLFYTRIRVPKSVVCNDTTLSAAYRYLPLVGLIVGGISALVFMFADHLLPLEVSVVCAMITMLLLTGTLHEDGLADFADGFGAGRDKESRLRIMKDSHIGTYGVLALVVALLMKYSLLSSTQLYNSLIPALIVANGACRFFPLIIIISSKYVVRDNAKAGHNVKGVSTKNFIVGALFGLLPLFWFGWKVAIAYISIASILTLVYRRHLLKKIDGYTGDTLGALILVLEIIFYMVLLINIQL